MDANTCSINAEAPVPLRGPRVGRRCLAPDLAVLTELEARGAACVGVINAATAALVAVIGDALRTEAWQGYGIRSPEHWVALRFGLSGAHAARLVAAARLLPSLPACAAAFAAGEITEDHVAAITNAAPVHPTNDGEVAALARTCTVNQFRHALTGLPRPEPAPDPDADPDDPPPPPSPRTFVRRSPRPDGTWSLTGVLDALDGALTDKALEAATDRLFRLRYGADANPALRQHITALDALRLLMQTALDALDPATALHPDRLPSDRYVVNIHVGRGPGDHAEVHLGPRLPDALRDELLCDTRTRLWTTDRHGSVNLGRTRRTVDPKLRLAVETRDRGCVIPGCDCTRGLRIHHLVQWPAGGRTDTNNLVALCRPHHSQLHRGELHITGNPDTGTLTITDAHGRPLDYHAPAPCRDPDHPDTGTVTGLVDAAHAAGLPAGAFTERRGERANWASLAYRQPPPPPREPPG